MAVYSQPNLTGGIDDILLEVGTSVPGLVIGLLLFVFGVVFLSGSATQRRTTGYADIPMWATMGSVSTLMIGLLLSIKEGLINLEVLGILVAITMFSGLWLFMSRGRGEI